LSTHTVTLKCEDLSILSIKVSAQTLTGSHWCCPVQLLNLSQCNNHDAQCTQHPALLVTITSNKL